MRTKREIARSINSQKSSSPAKIELAAISAAAYVVGMKSIKKFVSY